ncbi:hypothetical protein A3850_005115 [Lewinella sp. 4G2]|nr:hypothetical protein A3850_005115 [Lewinella sp. 4G2]
MLCIGALPVVGQVNILPLRQGMPLYTADQLFDVQILNTSNQLTEGFIVILVQDSRSGQIANLQSRLVTLQAGERITGKLIEWENSFAYNSLSDQLSAERIGLSFAQFKYCYRFVTIDQQNILGEYCYEDAPVNLAPPRLSTPRNTEVIQTINPVLTWLPVAPVDPTKVNYSLRLVEKEIYQSSIEALTTNFPLLDVYGLGNTVLVYPVGGIPLEKDKEYAWQVTASIGDIPVGTTEVWTFKIGEERVAEDVAPDGSFRRLKSSQDGMPYQVESEIRFAYDNYHGSEVLNYRIYEATDLTGSIEKLPNLKLVNGLNQLRIKIKKRFDLDPKEVYMLEVIEPSGKRLYLNFITKDIVE